MVKTQNISLPDSMWSKMRVIAIEKQMTVSEYIRSVLNKEWKSGKNGSQKTT